MGQPKEQTLDPAVAMALAKFGTTVAIGSAKLITQGQNPQSPADALALGADLSSMTSRYQTTVNKAAFASSTMQAGGELVITSLQVGATLTGVGAFPAAAVASVARYGNDKFASYLAKEGKDRAMGMLSSGLQKMSKAQRDKFDEKINNRDYEGAAVLFDARTGKLAKMASVLKDDRDAAANVHSYVIESLKQGVSSVLIDQGRTHAQVQDIELSLAKQMKITTAFSKDVGKKLKELGDKSEELQSSIAGMSIDIADLRSDTNKNAYQIGVIQEILFDQQSPQTKLALLENDAKPGLTAEQRDRLKKVLTVQVKQQQILAKAGEVVNVVSDISTIMTNFGIADQRVGDLVKYGSIATTALSQAFSGNYLGAIAAVSGLFGGAKQDPVEANFQKVFAQLAQVQKRLDKILELQVKTLEAIGQLSSQLAEVERRFNIRLDSIDFDLKVISDIDKVLLWRPYESCGHMWDAVANDMQEAQPLYGFRSDTLTFSSVTGLKRFLSARHGSAFTCAAQLSYMYSQLKNSAIFGDPIKLTYAVTQPLGGSGTGYYSNNDLRIFLDQTYIPAYKLLLASWIQRAMQHPAWGPFSGSFGILASPASTSTELLARVRKLDSLGSTLSACGSASLLSDRGKDMLCTDPPNHDREGMAHQRVSTLLAEPVVRDQMSWLVRYTALAAPAYNFAPGGGSGGLPMTYDQMLAANPPTPYGKELLYGGLMMTDVAVAQQALTYGDLTAYFIYEQLWDPVAKALKQPAQPTPAQAAAAKLLSNPDNPWLRRNVAMIVLEKSEKKCAVPRAAPSASASVASPAPCKASDLTYRTGVLGPFYELADPAVLAPAVSVPLAATQPIASAQTLRALTPEYRKGATEWLLTMFDISPDVTLTEVDDHNGRPTPRRVSMKLGDFDLQLPTEKDWASKTLDYPQAMFDRVAERNLLAERWSEYAMFDKWDANATVRLLQVMAADN
ncbi:MAG: hypothetical protein Q7T10_18260 [Rhodoferax sp.]|uniref:hypothetical protein n=1 Tax=Rhodoferax sp. TaxID=50421 RepID=UPI00271EEDD0|nr:hypothetical protein [Rhodoferax sp.]MDO8450739.1 hypothetical protein [Rhodoferax sp.]